MDLAPALADGPARPPRGGGLMPWRSAAGANRLHFFERAPQELLDQIKRASAPAAEAPLEQVSVCHVNLAREARLRGGEWQTALLVLELGLLGLRQRLVMRRGGPLDGRLDKIPGLTLHPVDGRRPALRACRKAVLIHAHEAHAGQVAWAVARGRGNYLITRRDVVTRGAGEPVPRARRLTRRIYGEAGMVVAVSEAIAAEVRERQAGTAVNLTRIPDAWLRRELDREEAEKIRRRFGGACLVAHAAAMDHEVKGQQVLLEAARRLEDVAPGLFQFALLGAGRREEALRAQARGLSSVHFAGWVEEPLPWLAACNIFALPSLREGLGSVALEAMYVGAPVVASRTGGIPEVVTADCGVLVPPGDAAALADALLRLARDPERLRRLSRGAMDRAQEFSSPKMAERYMEVYRKLGLEMS